MPCSFVDVAIALHTHIFVAVAGASILLAPSIIADFLLSAPSVVVVYITISWGAFLMYFAYQSNKQAHAKYGKLY